MVSYAPDTQSLLFNHMTSFVDYRSDKEPKMCINEGSIYSILSDNPKFTKFKKIIDTANMMGLFNDIEMNSTLFATPDDFLKHLPDCFFTNMDNGMARQIVNSSLIPKILAKDLITSSPVSYLYTKNPYMRMYVTNINSVTTLNNCAKVIQFDKWCSNGIVHVIDNLLSPNEDHFMN